MTYSIIDTKIGKLYIYLENGKILKTSLKKYDDNLEYAESEKSIVKKIENALESDDFSKVDFDFSNIKSFQMKVLNELLKIPKGQTRSYSEIAIAIGNPKAVRAVGTAIAKNPFPIVIPCHRVIKNNGKTGNYYYGTELKELILDLEKTSSIL